MKVFFVGGRENGMIGVRWVGRSWYRSGGGRMKGFNMLKSCVIVGEGGEG